MPEPQTYAAQDEALKSQAPKLNSVGTVEPIDEFAMLLQGHDRGQWLSNLRAWSTFMPADRLKMTTQLVDMKMEEFDPDRKIGKDRRRRYLCLIILREVFHPRGNPEVAREAFRGLFPEKGH